MFARILFDAEINKQCDDSVDQGMDKVPGGTMYPYSLMEGISG